MAKRKLSAAIAAARRESDGQDLDALVTKIMAGVADVIRNALKANPDRTGEILEALSKSESAVTEALAKIDEIKMPDVDLTPVVEKIGDLETKVEESNKEPPPKQHVDWEFDHEYDSRGRLSRTHARPMNGG